MSWDIKTSIEENFDKFVSEVGTSLAQVPIPVSSAKKQFLSKADQLLQKTGLRVDLERRPVRPYGVHVFPHGMGRLKFDLWAWKRMKIKPSMYLEYWFVLRFAGTTENILFYMERGIHYMANHLIRNHQMSLLVETCEKKSGLTADDLLIESKENQLFVRGNELRPFGE